MLRLRVLAVEQVYGGRKGGEGGTKITAVCCGSSGMCWLAKVLDVRRCCTKSFCCPNIDRAAAVLCQVKVESCLGKIALFVYIRENVAEV